MGRRQSSSCFARAATNGGLNFPSMKTIHSSAVCGASVDAPKQTLVRSWCIEELASVRSPVGINRLPSLLVSVGACFLRAPRSCSIAYRPVVVVRHYCSMIINS